MKKGFPFATNAALKMYELIKELNLIDCNKPIRAFCDAELPGAFIVTINHFVKTVCKTTADFDWVGSSYYPEAAAKAGDLTILGDKYGFYTNNRTNWLIGPKPNALPADVSDTTGDLMNGAVVVTLANAIHARFETTGGATLATSDAGIDVSEDYSNQECDTSLLNYGQIIAAILALAPGGHMVTKQYTFNRPFSRSLIALVSLLFDEAYVVKPVTSRPGNSEVYIVGKGFLGIEKPLAEELVERFSVYSGNPSAPCKYAPLFNPEDYKAIDQELLKAATKIHTEQQVEFLNEFDEYHKNKDFDLDLSDISNKMQKEWLKKYPLVDINKTDMMYYIKNPNPNPLTTTSASANATDTASASATAPAALATQAMATLNTAASTAYNALDNLGNFVSDTLTGQAAASETKEGQVEEIQPSILEVAEEEKEEGEEKPEESNKKVITI
jgi:23S rRNA U2552 (ribose-2'-O)-methylase RlmE/FtsJ